MLIVNYSGDFSGLSCTFEEVFIRVSKALPAIYAEVIFATVIPVLIAAREQRKVSGALNA